MKDMENQTANEVRKLWNSTSGCAWVELQELIDQTYIPFEDLLMNAVRAKSATRVLDIGCGTGSTTLAAARLVGSRGHCTGIDISEPMLAVARSRAERENTPASFICADAQSHPFEPASFDMFISRFGVMFFADSVQAFVNLRRAATNAAECRFIVWRSPAENPFMTTAERAAAPLLPDMPARKPDAPGQFAFADSQRVRGILADSRWAEIDIRPIDVDCSFPEKELVRYFTRLGPVGNALQQADERKRTEIIETVRSAFDPFVHGAEVRFTAACWMISARASAS